MIDGTGAISLHRQIQNHWIWKDANKLKWWIDILLTVNYKDTKVNLGNEVFICKRGESLLSLRNWAERWHVPKDTARNFLKLLEKDNMIICSTIEKCPESSLHATTRVKVSISTRLTVCNYDTYQLGLHVKQTQDRQQPYPNNNIVSKDTNIDKRREDFKNELAEYLPLYGKDMLNAFYRYWAELNKSKTKMKFETEKTWELNLRLAKWKDNSLNNSFKNKSVFVDTSNVGN